MLGVKSVYTAKSDTWRRLLVPIYIALFDCLNLHLFLLKRHKLRVLDLDCIIQFLKNRFFIDFSVYFFSCYRFFLFWFVLFVLRTGIYDFIVLGILFNFWSRSTASFIVEREN